MKKKRTRKTDIVLLLALLPLAFALYWHALRVFFSLDDLQFLLRAAGIEPRTGTLSRFISTRLFFDAGWRLFGGRAWPYHLTVLLLHAVNASILYAVARRLRLARTAAYLASVLFVTTYVAFLPLHWISGIQEVSMTFFALVAAYFFLGRTAASLAVSLAASCLSMLCKETSVLLLPALALVLPVSKKRRWILGSAGLALGVVVLVFSGSLTPRHAGNAYESSFGANVVWNLLTYSAWLARFWDYFPDRLPQYDMQLAGWGLILPFFLALVAWRAPKTRGPIAKTILVFLLTIAPVLPLIRHSYLYYLYLPLVPFWLLSGAFLGGMSRSSIATGVLAVFMLHSLVNGVRHRNAEIAPGVPEDPVLRYAATAGTAVATIRAGGEIERGDYLVLKPMSAETINLSKGSDSSTKVRRERFSMVEQALLGGKALRLFFPAMRHIRFAGVSSRIPGWENMHLYLTYGLGDMAYLGYGEEGRLALARGSFDRGLYDQAQREYSILLTMHPNDPVLLYYLGITAAANKDTETLHAIIGKLDSLAGAEDPRGRAHEALQRLKQHR